MGENLIDVAQDNPVAAIFIALILIIVIIILIIVVPPLMNGLTTYIDSVMPKS